MLSLNCYSTSCRGSIYQSSICDIIFNLFLLHLIVFSVRMGSYPVFIIRCAIAPMRMLPQPAFLIPFQPIPQQAKKLAIAIAVAKYFENTLVHAEINESYISV